MRTQKNPEPSPSFQKTLDPSCLTELLGSSPRFEFELKHRSYPKTKTQASMPRATPSALQRPAEPRVRAKKPKEIWAALILRRGGLGEDFSRSEVRKAFRRLALVDHPDRGGSGDAFLRLKAAEKTLLALFS